MTLTPGVDRPAPDWILDWMTGGESAGDSGVRIQGLAKTFRGPQGPIHAVRGIDVSIAAGETVSLLGPNGAGKSTTIDMLLGLARPDAGTVAIFGRPPRAAVDGGTWFPITSGFLHSLGQFLPSRWLVQASHVALNGHGWGARGWITVAAWTSGAVGRCRMGIPPGHEPGLGAVRSGSAVHVQSVTMLVIMIRARLGSRT